MNCPAGNRFAPGDLRRLHWLSFGNIGDPFFDSVWQFLQKHKLTDGIRTSVPHIQTLKSLVRCGAGVAIVPDYTVVETDLLAHQITGLDFSQHIWMAARASSLNIPLVAEFRAALLPGE